MKVVYSNKEDSPAGRNGNGEPFINQASDSTLTVRPAPIASPSCWGGVEGGPDPERQLGGGCGLHADRQASYIHRTAVA